MKLCIHVRPRDDGQGWAVDVFDGRRSWSKTHLGEQPLNKAEAHRLAHKPATRILLRANEAHRNNRRARAEGGAA